MLDEESLNVKKIMRKFFRHQLVILSVGEKDFGNYSCLAENDLGKSRGYIELSGKQYFILYLGRVSGYSSITVIHLQ